VKLYRLKGKRITLKLGTPDVLEANFAPYFVGVIEEILPVTGGVVLTCVDAFTILQDARISTSFVNKHPLESVTALLSQSGVDAALYDAASLLPSAYSTSISHWVALRGGYNEYYENLDPLNAPAKALLSELAEILNGGIVPGEDGKLKFVRFDETASVSASWGDNDILAGSFKQASTYENLINRVIMPYGKRMGSPKYAEKFGDFLERYEINDATSQANFAYPGSPTRVVDHARETLWINGRGLSYTTILAATAVPFTLTVRNLQTYGLSGTRVPATWPVAAQDADAALSASRPAYLQIDNEIFKATTGTLNAGMRTRVYSAYYPNEIAYDVVARAQFGTAAADHTQTDPVFRQKRVFDVTIPVAICTELIRRFSNGCPVVELSTGLHWHAVQVGDLVNITGDQFLSYGWSGVDTNMKWEVIGKEVDPTGDAPGIKWTLARATETTPPAVSTSAIVKTETSRTGADFELARGLGNQDLTQARVAGCTVTAAAGLTVDIASGSVACGLSSAVIDGQTAVAMTASKDVWIAYDSDVKAFTYRDQTIGTARPTLSLSETMIAKVTTTGVAILSVVDLRNISQLVASVAVGTTAIRAETAVRSSASVILNAFLQD
jgi:hypothetical protein